MSYSKSFIYIYIYIYIIYIYIITTSSVNMFKNRICIKIELTDIIFWTLDKPMASLSTCHLELVFWDGNLVKSC